METNLLNINSGVYKAGFVHSQGAYEQAFDALFARLDELEKRLSAQRDRFGDRLTDSDVRFYTILVRFDAAYFIAFRANRRRLADYTHLWGYARDLYPTKGFGDTRTSIPVRSGICRGRAPVRTGFFPWDRTWLVASLPIDGEERSVRQQITP